MALIVPITLSPGRISVEYRGMGGLIHRAGVNYTATNFPGDGAEATDQAEELANALAPLFNEDSFAALGWILQNQDGITVARGGFGGAAILGTNADTNGQADSRSSSMTFKGRGEPPDFLTQSGLTMIRLFTGDTYAVPSGQTQIPLDSQGEWSAFAGFLDAHTKYWADVYGQKANVYDSVSPQFNAHWQRVAGS